MLYDDEERRIMAEAKQPNMRSSNINVKPFQLIIDDYLHKIDFSDQDVLDIGPGQFDFLDIMKSRNARKTKAVDFDPAIQKLGHRRGHETTLANLRDGWPLKGERFDGIFCRGSINLFWFSSPDEVKAFLSGLASSLRDNGWLWIAPWNNPSNADAKTVSVVEEIVSSWLTQNGMRSETPSTTSLPRYGIMYRLPKIEIWIKT